ncbi:hypothetical protein P692DRAFT_20805227 [Suillus brevipes Sb2]|jgi:hypothetical protein|nr:hypothetical protein P692DRAFT_20805227 [Suillus brevipes Sb2]
MDATSREHSSLETRKDVSCRRRQFVDEKANFVQSNTSPRADSSGVYRLPTEVLSQIFLFCLPQDQHLLPKPGLAPVLLTMICRRWREVAIGFPKLWCTLQLQFDHDDWQQRALCYDSWLKRSRGCPLSLRIVCREGSKLRDVLEPYTHQISSLTLIFSHYDKPFMVDDFHALKELTILKDGFDLKRAIDQSLSKLPVNLRRLDLTRVLVRDRQLVHSTWARLTHIEIKIHELDEFPRLLSLCPNLTFLSMDDITDPIKIEIPEPVTHANLQHLHIHGSFFNDYDVGVGLFNAITLPNLGFVEFRQKGPWPHEEFKAFVTRSKCPLESLVFIMAMSLTDQQQEELTSLLPSLKRIAGKVYPKDIPIHSILNSILTA